MTPANILNEAVDRIIQGDQAELDALLAAHPEARPDVEPLLEVAQQLASALPTEAPKAFVIATRRQLIRRAAARRAAMQKGRPARFPLPALFHAGPARRLAYTAMVLVAVLALILSGGGTAVAQSLPGQPLYGAKRTAEDAPLLMLSGAIMRADYLLTLLERRVYEVELLSRLDELNVIALSEVRMATGRALAAVQAVPLDRSLAQWTRLEVVTARQGHALAQAIKKKKQVPMEAQETLSYAWQVCTNTQAQAQARLAMLPPQVGATVPGWNPPGLTKTPQPPGLTMTPQPPGLTMTPQPPGLTMTPQPPGLTRTPRPNPTPRPKPTKKPK